MSHSNALLNAMDEILPTMQGPTDVVPAAVSSVQSTSWLFRFGALIRSCWQILLGAIGLLGLLAMVLSIPVINLLGLGYLLEVSKRTAERRPLREMLVGIDKGRQIGGALVGSWIWLLPIRYLSHVAYESSLIDPSGPIASRWYFARWVVAVLVVAHIAAALMCGGKLRYFFWPLIAPVSMLAWLARKTAGQSPFKRLIRFGTEPWCPGLADDIGRVSPIKDWFLPAIFLQKMAQRDFLSQAYFSSVRFVESLRLWYYFRLGLWGFLGTLAWLLVPTLLLAGATLNQDSVVSVSAGLLGTLIAIPLFAILPIIQTQFSVTGDLRSFLDPRRVLGIVRRAPIWHLCSWIMVVVLSIPFYLLKIETVPEELLWILALVFLMFALPARVIMGWALSRSLKRQVPRPWWLTVPVCFLMLIASSFYVFVLTTTRYLSWNGALSLFENHTFLLPVPYSF
jgi:hypothetical protein